MWVYASLFVWCKRFQHWHLMFSLWRLGLQSKISGAFCGLLWHIHVSVMTGGPTTRRNCLPTKKILATSLTVGHQLWAVRVILRRSQQTNYGKWVWMMLLTPSTPAVPNCCCSQGLAPYWSNSPFLFFNIQALWRSVLGARAPECQN